jgi:hypothetical protein
LGEINVQAKAKDDGQEYAAIGTPVAGRPDVRRHA